MKYLNQLDYEHIPYPTDVDAPDSPMHQGTVKLAGCGLCCLCMVVDQLTLSSLPLRRCLALSVNSRANHSVGTDLQILAPLVAQRYDLTHTATDDLGAALDCLHHGGRVIANVAGDRDDGTYVGVFSHGGHYILLVSADEDEVCVLDPSWRPDKFHEPGRPGKVRLDGKFVYCTTEVLHQETDDRSPRYHLFQRS